MICTPHTEAYRGLLILKVIVKSIKKVLGKRLSHAWVKSYTTLCCCFESCSLNRFIAEVRDVLTEVFSERMILWVKPHMAMVPSRVYLERSRLETRSVESSKGSELLLSSAPMAHKEKIPAFPAGRFSLKLRSWYTGNCPSGIKSFRRAVNSFCHRKEI